MAANGKTTTRRWVPVDESAPAPAAGQVPQAVDGQDEYQRFVQQNRVAPPTAAPSSQPAQPSALRLSDVQAPATDDPMGADMGAAIMANAQAPAPGIVDQIEAARRQTAGVTPVAPMDPQAFSDIKLALGAMPRDQRMRLADAPGWKGRAARAAIDQLDAEQSGMDALRLGQLSPTLEGRTAYFAGQGAPSDVARSKAIGEMVSGAVSEPVRNMRDGGQMAADDAAARQEGVQQQRGSLASRAGFAAVEGLKAGSLGVASAALRAAGDNETAQALEISARRSKIRVESANELTAMRARAQDEGTVYGSDAFWENQAIGGISSAAQNAPQMAAGMALTALTKNPAAGARLSMALMTSQAFGDEYVSGRMAHMTPGQAASRAGIMAGFEYLGERFGLIPQAMKAVRGKATDVPLEELPQFLERYVAGLEKRGVLSPAAANLARGQLGEQFGEQLTTAGQYWIDGTPLGMDQPVSLTGYLEAARDTAIQTLIATGALQGAHGAASAVLSKPKAADQPSVTTQRDVDQARSEAIGKWQGTFAKSPQAGPAESAAVAMPAQDQPSAAVAPAAVPQAAQAPVAPADQQITQVPQGSLASAAAAAIDERANDAATSDTNDLPEPTDAQKEAGNYAKGHVRLHGLDIAIENPRGSTRRGTSPEGVQWESTMAHHYGYIKGSLGNDGDQVDTFIGQNPESTRAFVVDQIDPKTGRFDEHKVVLGADNIDQAREIYQANYEPGWRGLGAITELPMAAFKSWVKDGAKRKPLGDIAASTQLAPDRKAEGDAQAQSDVNAALSDIGSILGAPQSNEQIAPQAPTAAATAQAPQEAENQGGAAAPGAGKQGAGVPGAGGSTSAQAPGLRSKKGREQFNLDPEHDTLLQALAKLGGVRRDAIAGEFGLKPEELKHTVSTGKLKAYPFRKTGGMDMDQAITALAEAGYFTGMPDDEHRNAFERAIYDELGGSPLLTPQGQMRQAAQAYNDQQEQDARAQQEEDAQAQAELDAEREAIMAEAGLSDGELSAHPDHAIEIEAEAQDMAAGMRALGFTEQEIADELARQNQPDARTEGSRAQDPEVANRQAQAPPAAGDAAPRDAGGARRDTRAAGANDQQGQEPQDLTLEAQTQDELRAKAQREETAAKAEASKKAAEQARLKKADDERDARARADATVDDFQLGQSADQQLSGMGDLFAQQDQPAATAGEGAGGSRPKPDAANKPADSLRSSAADSDAVRQAKADAMKALGDLADIFSKGTRLNMVPEQEQKLLPVLTRLFDAAFRLGYLKFKDAARFALDQIRSALGDDVADQITLEHLQGGYIGMSGRYKGQGADSVMTVAAVSSLSDITDNGPKEGNADVPSGNTDLERDRQDAGAADAPVEGDLQSAGFDQRTGAADAPAGAGRGRSSDDQGVSAGGAAAGRASGDRALPGAERSDGPEQFPARGANGKRSDDPGFAGVQPETIPAKQVEAVAVDGLRGGSKRVAQRQAQGVKVTPGDLGNIRESLPFLLPEQQEDVHKAEQRFAKPDGYGMLLTNGTGTGKTYSGLGMVKRFERQGKDNIMILVPDAKIMEDWVESGKDLMLEITPLGDTKDAGKGITITTYANFGDNDEVVRRNWDFVLADEAHTLMQSAEGGRTKALDKLRAITLHPSGYIERYSSLNRDDIEERKRVADQIDANAMIINNPDTTDQMVASLRAENSKLEKKHSALNAKLSAAQDAEREHVANNQLEKRPRAGFLSATPFAYEKTVDWANGYLFDYKDGYAYDETSLGYNDPTPYENFFITHFGYRKRYGKLTEPDAKVNRGLMQRQFNGFLRKAGSLSGRQLKVDADYDRKFVLVDSAVGNAIDRAIDWVDERAREQAAAIKDDPEAQNGYDLMRSMLRDSLYGKTGHLVRRYLLEAIKAKEVVQHVRDHMALGRKVVVFHDFKKGGAFNPFKFDVAGPITPERLKEMEPDEAQRAQKRVDAYNAAVEHFAREFPDLAGDKLLANLISPIQRFTREFPGVLLINGDEKKTDLLARYKKFNDDAEGPSVALVQSAKNKGWSGHDTTGKHQRVLFNLGLPTQPTMTIQQEGRIYRTGQVSDAMFRYLNTGTNWERWAFAETIANRASAAENLANGEQSRALRDSFITAFEESDKFPAGHEGEGKGGKERDSLAYEAITEFDRAKAFYWGTQKKTSKTKAQEGTDYFATAEPIGLKMVQWTDMRAGEDALEPSAGHGAIARWFDELVNRTAVEPSSALGSRLGLVFDGKIIRGTFEDLNVVNKFDGVAMNPPFGTAGRTAIDHVAKAATHLRDFGRIVALIPEGPAADKKFDAWFYGEATRPTRPLADHPTLGPLFKGDTITVTAFGQTRSFELQEVVNGRYLRPKGAGASEAVLIDSATAVKPTGKRNETYKPAESLHLVGEVKLPSVAFERAGTAVRTRILVIDKLPDGVTHQAPTRKVDLSQIDDIGELFDRIENIDMPKRLKPAEAEDVVEPDAKGEQPQATPAKQQRQEAKAQRAAATKEGAQQAADAGLQVIEHTTGKGKVLRGVVTQLSQAEAKEIDPYTFKKDGGFFIRAEHIPKLMAREQGDAAQFSLGEPAGFVSELASQVQASQMNAGTGAAWQQYLDALAKRGAVKADEIEWTGLREWLAMQPGKVRKADISAFLDANGVRVEEVNLAPEESGVELDDWLESWAEDREGPTAEAIQDGDTWDNIRAAARKEGQAEVLRRLDAKVLPSKFDRWTVPGGKNYREVLLTLPIRTGWDVFNARDGKPVANFPTEAEARADAERRGTMFDFGRHGDRNDTTSYKSGHWDQPNVLAHIRVDERTDTDGKRVLFVQEIQSDWGQEGKRKGFRGQFPDDVLRAAIKGGLSEAQARSDIERLMADPLGNDGDPTRDNWARLIKATEGSGIDLNEVFHDRKDSAVPSAPFVNKTDAWVALAIKRVIKMAADEGFDRVAFINGQQAADLFDLSKQVSKVEWLPQTKVLRAFDTNGNGIYDKVTDADKIEDVIGKEAAKNLLDSEPYTTGSGKKVHRLEGVELKVGGEGMRTFYDQIVPKVAKDVLKKVAGGQIVGVTFGGSHDLGRYSVFDADSGDLIFRTDNQRDAREFVNVYAGDAEIKEVDASRHRDGGILREQNGFDITPAMREKAAQGLPLFSRSADVSGRQSGAVASISAIDMADVIKRNLKGWRGIGLDRIVAVDHWTALPQEILQDAKKRGFHAGAIEGVVYRGRVYLVRENLRDAEHAQRVLFHEVLGHLGIKAALAGKPTETLNALWEQLNGLEGVAKLAKGVQVGDGRTAWDRLQPYVQAQQRDQVDRRAQIIDELIAFLAQAKDTSALTRFKGYMADVKAAIVGLLRRLDLTGLADRLDRTGAELDVLRLVRDARQAIERGKTRDGRDFVLVNRQQVPAFSGKHSDGKFSLDQSGRLQARQFLDGPPVVELDGSEFAPDGTQLTDKVVSWLQAQNKEQVISPDIGKVMLDKRAVKSSIFHGVGRDKATAFAALPGVIERGRLVFSEGLRGSRDGGQSHIIAAPVRIGGRDMVAAVLVKSDPNGSRMYVHEVVLKEKLQPSAFKTSADAAGGAGVRAGAEAGAIRSVLQDIFDVKSEDGAQYSLSGQPGSVFTLPEFGRTGRFIEAIQNRYNRWKQAIDAVRAQGGTISEANDFYAAEERYWGIVGAQLDDFKTEVQDFVKAVQADGLELSDVALYAYAKHAPERNERIAEINPKFPDGGSGMTNQQAADILAKAKADGIDQQLERHAAELGRWTQGTRDLLLNQGLLSQDEYDSWNTGYQHYVPLRGQPGQPDTRKGTGSGFDIRGRESFRAMGRRSQAGDIIEQIMQDRARALIRAGKNEVLRRFARFVLDNPDPQLWQINAVQRRRALVDTPMGEQVVEWNEVNEDRENTVALKDGGQTIYITVHDDQLLKQLKNLHDEAKLPFVVEALHWANRLLSRMYTSLNPVFTILNGARDAAAGTVNMIGVAGARGASKLVANLPKAYREAFRGEVKGQPSAMYEEYRRTGGKTGFMDFKDIEGYSKELAQIAQESMSWRAVANTAGAQAKATASLRKARGIARKLMDRIEAYNGAVENATRFAAFKAARETGKSVAEAASIAKNITVNFNRRGTMTPVLGSFFLFFNPAVQGTARMVQALGSRQVQIAMGSGMAAIFGLALANAAMGGDDDDDGLTFWDKIPDEVKDRNLIIMLPPGSEEGEAVPGSKYGRYIKIPMPYGYNTFAVLASTMADMLRHQMNPAHGVSPARGAMRVFKSFVGSWVPVSDVAPSFDNAKGVAMIGVPDALDPLVEPLLNMNSFGKQLYPEGFGQDKIPDSEKVFGAQKNSFAHRAARAINSATGGSQYQEGFISLTPATINNVIRGYGGGVASFVTSIADTMATRGIARDKTEWWRAPFVKQVYGEVGELQDQAMAYDRLGEIEKSAEPMRRALKAGDRQAAQAIVDDVGQIAKLGPVATAAREQLTRIRRQEIRVMDSTTLTDAEKNASLRQWDRERQKVYDRVNQAWAKAVQQDEGQ